MITGTMRSERIGHARIWTLTVPVQPRPGQLIEWSEPAVGHCPARSGVRGWVSSKPSTRPGTVLVTVAAEGERWTVINVEAPENASARPAVHSHQYDDEPPVQTGEDGNLYPYMCRACEAETGNPYAWVRAERS